MEQRSKPRFLDDHSREPHASEYGAIIRKQLFHRCAPDRFFQHNRRCVRHRVPNSRLWRRVRVTRLLDETFPRSFFFRKCIKRYSSNAIHQVKKAELAAEIADLVDTWKNSPW